MLADITACIEYTTQTISDITEVARRRESRIDTSRNFIPTPETNAQVRFVVKQLGGDVIPSRDDKSWLAKVRSERKRRAKVKEEEEEEEEDEKEEPSSKRHQKTQAIMTTDSKVYKSPMERMVLFNSQTTMNAHMPQESQFFNANATAFIIQSEKLKQPKIAMSCGTMDELRMAQYINTTLPVYNSAKYQALKLSGEMGDYTIVGIVSFKHMNMMGNVPNKKVALWVFK